MEPAIFSDALRKAQISTIKATKEAVRIERFIHRYSPFDPPLVRISGGRKPNSLYTVITPGYHFVDFSPKGPNAPKIHELVWHVQNRRRVEKAVSYGA